MRFGDFKAVDDASFSLEHGQFLTILGPSGSGKTTLLRMIAGFLTPTKGEISINGQAVSAVAANKRSIGMVFQKLALFPHMTAAENVAFPLKMRRFDATRIADRVTEFLQLVRLDGLEDRRINELSGGQQQRVAIARALVFEPDLLLLDEPLAALDRKLREEMQLEFRRIQKELGVTTINVTHDQREALVVSDQIIVMDDGKIQQDATPTEMYRTPGNPFVANFIGVTNVIAGELAGINGESVDITADDVTLSGILRSNPKSALTGAKVRCGVRAEQIRIASDKAELEGLDATFEGVVTDVIFEGERLLYELSVPALGTDPVRIYHHDQNNFATHELGRPVHIGWESRDLHVFVAE
ncbi:ABC transporter ATP-binding protein [Rhodophyticola sp. CCM32]|uniref:ABC transporter ATP-binding protein n=1 Tax=Rhodophyticola sp. CCM32 TaxID=2916397 RepID=UPI00107F923F|nr:ABC transporter ATP-binding protein [Rhodophyticola sp. CCM32]QBY01433.1 ABC transporter ATP-binding protein [Rhodophyticola sp. CCM32]